jgi:hypothetical protein
MTKTELQKRRWTRLIHFPRCKCSHYGRETKVGGETARSRFCNTESMGEYVPGSGTAGPLLSERQGNYVLAKSHNLLKTGRFIAACAPTTLLF